MAVAKTVTQYDAFLYPNDGKQSGRINLYCGDHRLYILFKDPGETLPSNTFDASRMIGVAYQHFSQYPHFIDLIRNEKPVWVTFRPEDRPPSFVVYCASEPPGEGEV